MGKARRRFAPLHGRQMHYRRLGSGAPLVMLPPLPFAGKACLPLAEALASRFTILIVDPPGYGLSDPLGPEALDQGFAAYAESVLDLIKSLGVRRFGLIGQGIGAVIALWVAKLGQDSVAGLALDFEDALAPDEPGDQTGDRFPDVAPRRDGAHLLTYWDMARSSHAFAPWNGRQSASRLSKTLPAPAEIHRQILDTMRAGEHYAHAPKLAVGQNLSDLVSGLAQAPLIIRRQGAGSARSVAATKTALGSGAHADISVVEAGEVGGALLAYFGRLDLPTSNIDLNAAQVDPDRIALQTLFIDTPAGQLLARACFKGLQGPPLVGLHDPAGSSRRLLGVLSPLVGRRPVIALDLPGSGESDPIDRSGVSIESYAQGVGDALDSLEIETCDVIGRYSGGQVGLELGLQRPDLVRSLIHYGIQIFDDAERPDLLAHYTQTLEPVWDGSHLVTAWAILRDMSLFWPWFNRTAGGVIQRDAAIDAASLHVRVLDLLKIGEGWRNAYASSFNYPMIDRMARWDKPTLFADMPGSASHSRLVKAMASAPQGCVRDLVGDPIEWAATFENFLDSAAK